MPKTFPVPCTKKEMNALIEASIDNEFYNLLFTVAKTTGRRLGEYYNVQVKDFDWEKGIMMTIVLKRKQRIKKEAVLMPDVMRMIRLYILKNKLKLEDYVFRKVSYRQIQNKVIHYAKKAEINHKVSFHNFRHYFITELSRMGWDYYKIAKLTGHSSPATLVHYDSSVASDVKEDALRDIKEI